METIWVVTALLGLVILALILPRRKKLSIPGLSPRSPTLGNLPELSECGSFQRFLTKYHLTYGSIFSFSYGSVPAVALSDPKYNACVAHLLSHHPSQGDIFATFLTTKFLGGTNGNDWKRRRRTYWEASFGPKTLSSRIQAVDDAVLTLLPQLESLANSGEPFEARSFFLKFTIGTFYRFAFGMELSDSEVTTVFETISVFWDLLEYKLHGCATADQLELFEKGCAKIASFCQEIIAKKREKPNNPPLFIDMVLSDPDPEVTHAEVASALMGSTHTTSLLLTWCVYFLARYPEQQTRIREQLPETKGLVQAAVSSSCPAIQDFIDESLRMSLLTTFVQRLNDGPDIRLPGGYVIPTGTLVFLNAETLLWNSAYFSNPCEFNPTRFADTECRQQNLFFPFSYPGGRSCPGKWLALLQVSTCLATLLQNYSLSFHPDQKLPVGSTASFFTAPKESVFIRLHPR